MLCLLGLGLLAASGMAAAQWKWRDANGRIQYSDLPPPSGVPERNVLQRPRPPAIVAPPPPVEGAASAPLAASAPGAENTVDPALEAKRKQAEQEEAAKRQAEEQRLAQVRQQNCERARANLRTMDSGQRLARINEKGEREIIDDAARARETAQARQAIASECR